MSTHHGWLAAYAGLAFDVEQALTGTTGQLLIFTGPPEWRPTTPGREPAELVATGAELRETVPFPSRRAAYVEAHLDALVAVAERLAGTERTAADHASRCLGTPVGWIDESRFERAHAALDAALPGARGSLAQRLRDWRHAHTCPDPDRLPALVAAAVTECRRRTDEFVELPPIAPTDVVLSPGPHRGHYADGASTIHISADGPFNLADLLHVVAHESFPGHIAESALVDHRLVRGHGRLEHAIRFLLSPSFTVSEGIGLHAPEVAFPGDEGQAWLTDTVLAPWGLTAPLGDLAAIHRARNELWGAWGNAALLAQDGHDDRVVADHLRRWALLDDDEAAWAVGVLRTPGMATYVLAYAAGWDLVGDRLATGDRVTRARELLVEPLLPADLTQDPRP